MFPEVTPSRSKARILTERDFEDLFPMPCTLEVMAARLLASRFDEAIARDFEFMVDQREAT